jgi:hypothetical protein
MLDPGIDLLSVEHLPKVLGVSSSYTNMSKVSNDFSYEICHSMVNTVSPHSPVHENILTTVDYPLALCKVFDIQIALFLPSEQASSEQASCLHVGRLGDSNAAWSIH